MLRAHPSARGRARERGQILVLFALSAVVMIAMVGLVLDGGDTYAQRRDEQNGADLAAMAGANAYMNQPGGVTREAERGRSRRPPPRRPATATRTGPSSATVDVTVTLAVVGRDREGRHHEAPPATRSRA